MKPGKATWHLQSKAYHHVYTLSDHTGGGDQMEGSERGSLYHHWFDRPFTHRESSLLK